MSKSIFNKAGLVRTLMARALVMGVMQAPLSYAAVDGELGQKSIGEVTVTLKTEHLLKIAGLVDVVLPYDATKVLAPAPDEEGLTKSIDFCVFTNNADTNGVGYKYRLSVTSANGSVSSDNAFKLVTTSGNDDTVSYTVYVDDKLVGTHTSTVDSWGVDGSIDSGGASGILSGGKEPELLVCSAAETRNTRMWIVAKTDVVIAAAPDTYTDTLTLTVSAN